MDLAEEAIEKYGDPSASDRSGNGISFIIIGLGLFGTLFPYAAWFLEIGWRLQDAEPSEFALIVNRIGEFSL